MRYFIFFVHLFLLIYVSMGYAMAEQERSPFFESLHDIPVMHGMVEVSDMAMSFDQAEGRIAQAGAIIEGRSKQEILGFYHQTLLQMGWARLEQGKYRREQEKLEIFIEKSGGSILVRFALEPY